MAGGVVVAAMSFEEPWHPRLIAGGAHERSEVGGMSEAKATRGTSTATKRQTSDERNIDRHEETDERREGHRRHGDDEKKLA